MYDVRQGSIHDPVLEAVKITAKLSAVTVHDTLHIIRRPGKSHLLTGYTISSKESCLESREGRTPLGSNTVVRAGKW